MNKLESPSPKNAWCQDWLKLALRFLRTRFLKFVNNFAMSLLSPLRKRRALHLNKLESSSPKDALCQVWLKLAQWFLRRRFFKVRQCIFAICYYLPLEKDGTSFQQSSILITQEYFVPTLVEIGPVVLKKKIFKLSLFRYYIPLEKSGALI